MDLPSAAAGAGALAIFACLVVPAGAATHPGPGSGFCGSATHEQLVASGFDGRGACDRADREAMRHSLPFPPP